MIFNIYVRAYQGSHKRSSDLPEYKPYKHHKHLESQVPTRHHCCGHYGLCIWYSHQKGYIKEMEWLDWPLHHTAFTVSKWNEYNTIIGQRILDLDTGLPLLYKTFLPLSPSPGCRVLGAGARLATFHHVRSHLSRLCSGAAEQSRSVVIHMLMFTLHCVTFSTIPHYTPPCRHIQPWQSGTSRMWRPFKGR